MIDLDALAKELIELVGEKNVGMHRSPGETRGLTVTDEGAWVSIDVTNHGAIYLFLKRLDEYWWPVLRIIDRHVHPES